jgi:hypothetical protein
MPLDFHVPDKEERSETGAGEFGLIFDRSELLELSIVSVPANPNAVEQRLKKMISSGEIAQKHADEFLKAYPLTERDYQRRIRALLRRFVDMGASISHDEPSVEEKSPDSRMEDESTEECVSRKIPELIEEGVEQDQAVASASSICETECSDEQQSVDDAGNELCFDEVQRKIRDATVGVELTEIKSELEAIRGDLSKQDDLIKCINELTLSIKELIGSVSRSGDCGGGSSEPETVQSDAGAKKHLAGSLLDDFASNVFSRVDRALKG